MSSRSDSQLRGGEGSDVEELETEEVEMELETLVSALPPVLTGIVTDYVGLKSHTFYTLPETDYVNVGTDYVSINTRNPFSVWTRQDFEDFEFPNGITDEQWEAFREYAEDQYNHLNEVGDHQIEMMRIVYPDCDPQEDEVEA